MKKKDSRVFIRIESEWKERLEKIAASYLDGEPVTSMWLGRKLLKQGIIREEKRKRRKKRAKAK